ncbi:hypothetical protein ROK90_02095 [Cronobacter dublinensis]|nr:hypothetical protein [Cronobacter dublinensis]MDT3664809.1 hypothetical protein [Cronobacter dublinensis]
MQPSFDNLTFLLGDAAQLAALAHFRPRSSPRWRIFARARRSTTRRSRF